MNLSKSQFVRGLQCVKSLWLYKYRRDVAVTPPDASLQNIFDTGSRVGILAQELFPNGKTIAFEETSFNQKIEQTRSLIDQGVETIYEATFEFDGVFVMVDILHKGVDGWEIYEVKSSTEVKDVYLHDASVQYYVLNGSGLSICNVNIIHINNKYIRGKVLEIDKLFAIVDVTEDVKALQENIPNYLNDFKKVIDNVSEEPNIEIGEQCFDPYECDCMNYCWKDVPDYSIFDLTNIRKKKAFEFYRNGVVTFDDIDDISFFSSAQQIQINSEKNNEEIIDKEAIRGFIDSLSYPLYYLDFETFQQAVPEFEGVSPFQQIPFQYSIHIENADGSLEHKEFLGKEGEDPREALANQLLKDIPTNVMVLAYNMGFEKGVIRKLAELFPHLESQLMMIHNNILDLMVLFQKKYYYTPAMRGSYSIKYVLPALVPEFESAYKDLHLVHNGGEAMSAFANMDKMSKDEQREYRKALLEYCKLDTLAMVKVLEKLKESVR